MRGTRVDDDDYELAQYFAWGYRRINKKTHFFWGFSFFGFPRMPVQRRDKSEKRKTLQPAPHHRHHTTPSNPAFVIAWRVRVSSRVPRPCLYRRRLRCRDIAARARDISLPNPRPTLTHSTFCAPHSVPPPHPEAERDFFFFHCKNLERQAPMLVASFPP